VQHQQQADVVAHDRVLVLQVAVQAEALAGQVLADHRHAQVGAVPAAVLLRERVPEVAGRVGPRLRASASSASHSRLGRPPRSQSVLASSRRWSKNLCCRPAARAA
jgi:hypothetical protein